MADDAPIHRNDRPKRDRRAKPTADQLAEGLLGRTMPQSVEAERAVLGSLLLLPERCDEVALILRPDDFYDDANRKIYDHMVALHEAGRTIDSTLLIQRLKDGGDWDLIGGLPYLGELASSVTTAAHAEHYARIVKEKSQVRALVLASNEILQEAYEPSNDARQLLTRAEERVFAILESKGENRLLSLKEVLHESLARIDARMKNQHAFGGLETGFTDFDDMTGGLHSSELIILAARPSMGKTALALNIVEHVAIDCQQPTLFVSLEMSGLELVDRLLCSRAKVNGHRLRNGQISREESNHLIRTANQIAESPLKIDDAPNRTMTEIAANARRMKRNRDGKGGLALIVIDYLQLIEPDNPRDPRQEQVAKIARRLKGLARELKVPVLCLAQVNRQVESTSSNKPQLSHLRESGAIEQDADVVMFVHREEYYQTSDEDREAVRGQAELLIRKQRNGPTGDVKLTWLNDFTRFTNAAPAPLEEFRDFGDYN